jgi:hypothetical protein
MRRLLFSGLALIALLLAGVQQGSADQLYYCKPPTVTNQPQPLFAAPPLCGPGYTLTSINTGAIAGRAFKCGAGIIIVQVQ